MGLSRPTAVPQEDPHTRDPWGARNGLAAERGAPSPTALALGARLQRWRTSRKLSQAALAAELGISRRTLRQWELGERRMPPEGIMRLALAQLHERLNPPPPGL